MSVGKHVDFGMTDEKGRKIGARVRLYTRRDDLPITVEVWATRDGEVFGSEPPVVLADDADEAKAIVDRRLEAMAKRYAKKAKLRAADRGMK